MWCIPDGLSTQRRTDTDASLVQSALAVVAGESFAQQPAATLEHVHWFDPRKTPTDHPPTPPNRSRPASSRPRAALATASTWAADTAPSARAVSKAGIGHTPRIDPTPPLSRPSVAHDRQHLRRRLRATLSSELAGAAGDRHVDGVDPAPHPLRQAHDTGQTGPITPRHIHRQQSGERLADTTIFHHQTPLTTTINQGKPMRTTIDRGVATILSRADAAAARDMRPFPLRLSRMPFTFFAHQAPVLPVARRWPNATGRRGVGDRFDGSGPRLRAQRFLFRDRRTRLLRGW